MTSYKCNNASRVSQSFTYDGMSCGIALVYFRGREGQHVVYEYDKDDKEFLMRFATVEEARTYWRKLRGRLESKGYVAGKIEKAGK